MTSRPDEGLAGGPLVLRWLSAFADVPAESIEAALRYRAAETDRHVALGGVVINPAEHWTTLRDPAGLVYCITERRPRRR